MTNRLAAISRIHLGAFAIVCAALALRLGAIDRQGLWVDEVFSLAMATGHSLEHPAAVAVPSLGDFVEGAEPLPAEAFRRYAEHDMPPAGLGRVIRAVRLSDTSPPLYYVLLHGWTRWTGTSDVALRMFSLVCVLASFPLLWSLAVQIGGRAAVLPTLVLFGFAPVAVHYSIEGRMYALLWFLVLGTAWLVLRLQRHGFRYHTFVLLIGVSAAGLLTHYFYAFALAGIGGWLLWQPGRLDRRLIVIWAVTAALLALPWYLVALADLDNWRVTQGWLDVRPHAYRPAAVPFELVVNFFSNSPGERVLFPPLRWVVPVLAVLLVVLWWLTGQASNGRRTLLWLWAGAACLGPLAFDLASGAHAGAVPRYALAGLPPTFLLVATALARLSPRLQFAILAGLLLMWTPGLWRVYTEFSRGRSPLREVARALDEHARPPDLILVHSIPSGVVGVARYLEGSPSMTAWIGQLGQRRVPEDVEALTAGPGRVFLIRVRGGGPVAPHDYLREHATLIREIQLHNTRIYEFGPGGDAWFPAAPLRAVSGTAPVPAAIAGERR